MQNGEHWGNNSAYIQELQAASFWCSATCGTVQLRYWQGITTKLRNALLLPSIHFFWASTWPTPSPLHRRAVWSCHRLWTRTLPWTSLAAHQRLSCRATLMGPRIASYRLCARRSVLCLQPTMSCTCFFVSGGCLDPLSSPTEQASWDGSLSCLCFPGTEVCCSMLSPGVCWWSDGVLLASPCI
jgi:hypothetical protein